MTRLDRLTKKWALELEALARAFDDPFRWNIECIEILEEIERRITNASTASGSLSQGGNDGPEPV